MERLTFGAPDESYFPGEMRDAIYEPLTEVLRFSVAAILQGATDLTGEAMVTLLCHRVLVRPQEHYGGFFHRDLAPTGGRIGTIIWYPTIRHELVEGLEFIAYRASEDEPLAKLRAREPDFSFLPAGYVHKALVLTYPLNYPHGVLPGTNTSDAALGRRNALKDFVTPEPAFFIKDLVIVTVSERSPVEQ
jgi:hypothetical protein